MKNTASHPTHPVRNFFYVLWSVVNAVAFVGLFLALATETLPYRPYVIIGTATVLVLALVLGFFRPLLRRRPR